MPENEIKQVKEPHEIEYRWTLKKERFCQFFFANGGNGTRAAIEAGYAEASAADMACENLKKPDVIARLEELERDALIAAGVDANWIVATTKKLADMCMATVPVLDSKGVPTGEFKVDSAGANSALDKLGKFRSLWVERRELSGPNGGAIPIANTTEIEAARAMYEQLVAGGATPEEAVALLVSNGVEQKHLNGHAKLLNGEISQ